MGQSLEAFMQWKALVSLLLSCSEAVSTMLFLILMSIVIISSDILKDII
jgi:A1 cistron-splicing factor AAR2